jgi:hypothetical protein
MMAACWPDNNGLQNLILNHKRPGFVVQSPVFYLVMAITPADEKLTDAL